MTFLAPWVFFCVCVCVDNTMKTEDVVGEIKASELNNF